MHCCFSRYGKAENDNEQGVVMNSPVMNCLGMNCPSALDPYFATQITHYCEPEPVFKYSRCPKSERSVSSDFRRSDFTHSIRLMVGLYYKRSKTEHSVGQVDQPNI